MALPLSLVGDIQDPRDIASLPAYPVWDEETQAPSTEVAMPLAISEPTVNEPRVTTQSIAVAPSVAVAPTVSPAVSTTAVAGTPVVGESVVTNWPGMPRESAPRLSDGFIERLATVSASQATPAQKPSMWFSALWDEGTPAGDFFTRLRNYQAMSGQGPTESELQTKRLNAVAQLMNASRASSTMGTFGKLYNDLISAGVSPDQAVRQAWEYMMKTGAGNVVNIGDESARTRQKIFDTRAVETAMGTADELSDFDEAYALSQGLLDAIDSGSLSYTGKFGAELFYKIGQGIGLTSEKTEKAMQALRSVDNSYRRIMGKQTVGGGQVSNYEQEIIGLGTPGFDKTPEQNRQIIMARMRLIDIARAINNTEMSMLQSGYSVPEIYKATGDLRVRMVTDLYNRLGLGSRSESRPTRVTRGGKTYELGGDGLYHVVR